MNLHDQKTWISTKHRASVMWVLVITTTAIVFDGYDLVVYGTVLPVLTRDPSQLGAISPQQAGALGSYALVGVMVGALASGAVGDYLGRRRMMLVNIIWFSAGMGLAALSTSVAAFGAMRFLTGIGIGGLVATAGALIAECAPVSRKNLYNAIVYCGVPAGGVLAALIAIVLRDNIGWRGLFWIGAAPIVVLLPLAYFKLPESPMWMLSRNNEFGARKIAERFGLPYPISGGPVPAQEVHEKVGFAALATRRYALTTVVLGLMSFGGLLLTNGLNTWLPQIMENKGYGATDSILFLLVLNGGAIVGGLVTSRMADRTGAQKIIPVTFGLAALSLVILTAGFPIPVLLAFLAVAGLGTIGTQVLVYGLVSHSYPTSARAAGVAWCAGFGRLGGIIGPAVAGLLISVGAGPNVAFYTFAGVAVLAGLVTFAIPKKNPMQLRDASVAVNAAAPAGIRD
nr:aromatic acid/H+ symport family MFS transporter [Rhodococcus wratislaviensis]